MRTARLTLLMALLSGGLFLSCTDGSAPTDMELTVFGRMAVVPVFPGGGSASAVAGLPINTIQLTVFQVPGNVRVAQEVVTVNPNDDQWELGISVPLSNDPEVRYVLEILLINVTAGVRSVEWSARSAPVAIRQGQPVQIQQVQVARGGLDNLAVTGLTLSGPGSTPEGTAFSISASVQTNDASTSPTVFWTSLDPQIALINPDGTGTGLLPGVARIQADAGTVSAIHTITITAVPVGVAITPTSAVASAAGVDLPFAADVVDARGAAIVGQGVRWTIGDARILSDQGGGVFRSLAGGHTTVTATADVDASLSATADVDVQIVPVSIVVEQASPVRLSQAGETVQLAVVGTGAGGTLVHGLAAGWTSSDPTVVKVGASGVVTAVGTGSAIVTARHDTNTGGAPVDGASGAGSGASGASSALLTASIDVHVQLPAQTVVVTPATATLTVVGQTQPFIARAVDVNGVTLPNPVVGWTSTNLAVATVDPVTGLATAIASGSTDIVATVDGVSGVALLDVQAGVASVVVSPATAQISVGQTQPFTATAYDGGGVVMSGASFGWATSDAGIATVDPFGHATGHQSGTAFISATAQGVSGQAQLDVSAAGGPANLAYQTRSNTELVSGSASPIGTAHVYDPANILGPSPSIQILPGVYSGTQGGAATVLADGSFNYVPPVAYVGLDQFTANDDQGGTHTVDVTLLGPTVWYFDAAVSPGGDGTSVLPFNDLPGNSAPLGNPGDVLFLFSGSYPQDVRLDQGQSLIGQPSGLVDPTLGTIVPPGGLRPGINSSGGWVILADGTLVDNVDALDGDPAFESSGAGNFRVQNVSVLASSWYGFQIDNAFGTVDLVNVDVQEPTETAFSIDGGDATINVALGAATLGPVSVSNTVGGSVTFSGAPFTTGGSRPFDFSANAADISFAQRIDINVSNSQGLNYATSSGNLTLSDFNAVTNRTGVRAIANTGTLTIQNGSLNVTDREAIEVSSSAVDMTFGSVVVNGSAGWDGILMNGVTGATTIGTLDVSVSAGGSGLSLTTAGTFIVTNGVPSRVVAGAGSSALDISTTNVDLQVSEISSASSPTLPAVRLDDVTGVVGASTGLIDGSAVESFRITNGSADVSYGGDVTNPGSYAVYIDNQDNAQINFSGAIQSTTEGILINNSQNTAVHFTGNIDLALTTQQAFVAVNNVGGSLEVTGPGSVISTTTGQPLQISGMPIGPAGVTFESVSTTGSTGRGMYLDNTGAGAFRVTGTGTPGSGGTIVALGGPGIEAIQSSVTLHDIDITNPAGDGLTLAPVSAVTLDGVRVTGASGRSFYIQVTGGASTITNSLFQGSAQGNLFQTTTPATTPTLLVDNSTFTGMTGGTSASDLELYTGAGASLTVDVVNSSFGGAGSTGKGITVFPVVADIDLTVDNSAFNLTGADAIEVNAANPRTTELRVINGTTFANVQGGYAGVRLDPGGPGAGAGSIVAEIRNALFSDVPMGVYTYALDGTVDARIIDNTFTGTGSADQAIFSEIWNGTKLYVHGNQISGQNFAGILFDVAAGSAALGPVELHVFNNDVDHNNVFQPIVARGWDGGGICLDIAGNRTSSTIPGAGILVDQSGSGATSIALAGLNGGAGAEVLATKVQGYLQTTNPSASGTNANILNQIDAVPIGSCALPTLPTGALNARPAARPQATKTSAGAPTTITLTGADSDGDNLGFTIVVPPSGGSLGAITPVTATSATVVYTPSGVGVDAFTFEVDDGTGTISLAVVDIVNSATQAQNIAYSTAGNTALAAGGYVGPTFPTIANSANVFDPTPGLSAVNAGVLTSTQGGAVTLNADGSFSYVPPPLFLGVDDFAVDAGPGGTATVTLNVLGPSVWYVENLAAPGGDGTSAKPFDFLGAAEAISGAGDYVYVAFGDGTATNQDQGIILKSGQKLFGEAAGLQHPSFGTIVASGGGRPVIDHNTGGNAVTLGGANDVLGLELRGFRGIESFGVNLGGSVVDDVVINNVATGVFLSGAGGISFTNTHISGFTSPAFIITGAGPDVSFDAGSIGGGPGTLISSSGAAGGSVTFTNSTLTPSSGYNAVEVNGSVGVTMQIDDLDASAGTFTGIDLLNGSGTFTFNNYSSAGSSGPVVRVVGGAPDVTVNVGGAGIQNSAAELLLVSGTTGGSVTFTGAPMTGGAGGRGVLVQSSAGPVTFNNPVSITDPSGLASSAVYVFNNSGPVSFADLAVSTNTRPGILATSSTGTVTVTTGSIDATGVNAVAIDGPPIDMTFTNVTSTNSATDAISIQTSSGTFNAAGGTIVDPTDEAFYFNSNTGLTFSYGGSVTSTSGSNTYMLFGNNNTAGSTFDFDGPLTHVNPSAGLNGIDLVGNIGSTFNFNDDVTVTVDDFAFRATGGGTVNILGASNFFTSASSGHAFQVTDVEGSNTLTNLTVNGNPSGSDAIRVTNNSGAATVAFETVNTSGGANGLHLGAIGTGSLTATISGASFQGPTQSGVDLEAQGPGTLDVTVDQIIGPNFVDGAQLGVNAWASGVGTMIFSVDGMTITNSSQTGVVALYESTGGMTGTLTNNSISVTGFDGIAIFGGGTTGLGTFTIDSNLITGFPGGGIFASTSGLVGATSDLAITMTRNTFDVPQPGPGIWLRAQQNATVCAQFGGTGLQNVLNDPFGGSGDAWIVEQLQASVFRIEGLGGPTPGDVNTLFGAGNTVAGTLGTTGTFGTTFSPVPLGTCR